jgi:hypothetical protein
VLLLLIFYTAKILKAIKSLQRSFLWGGTNKDREMGPSDLGQSLHD